MVVETQHIFRRSLPPESVLDRVKYSSDQDAPQFSEIVVTTTRRGEDVRSTYHGGHHGGSGYNYRSSSSGSSYEPIKSSGFRYDSNCRFSIIIRTKELISTFFFWLDFKSRQFDPVPKWRLMEDDDKLRTLRSRVERYRLELEDESSKAAKRLETLDLETVRCIFHRLKHTFPAGFLYATIPAVMIPLLCQFFCPYIYLEARSTPIEPLCPRLFLNCMCLVLCSGGIQIFVLLSQAKAGPKLIFCWPIFFHL